MIPIRDNIRSQNYPVVTFAIIALNVIVFLWELSLGRQIEGAFMSFGIVPVKYSNPLFSTALSPFEMVFPFFTSMFLHGGFLHILGNMWFLYIFGDNVEDRLGHARYIFFYILSGIAAGLIHLFTNWHSSIPTIGASGAIAGVMGAYFLLHPKARVLTIIPIFFFIQFVEIPAYLFLGIWFFFQLLSATATGGPYGGIAWWAHIGGFVSGIVFLKVILLAFEKKQAGPTRSYTRRRSSPFVHPLHPHRNREDLDIRGEIEITEREAYFGTTKMVSVPHGLKRKAFRITLPPRLEDGSVIRLKGAGLQSEGIVGDLHLRVRIV